MPGKIKDVLMTRDGMSSAEADSLIAAAQQQLDEYLECGETTLAYDICSEFFGLEPDYIDELI